MYEIVMKIIYFIFILPYLIFEEAWAMFKKFMDKDKKRWEYFPYFLLAIFVVLLVVLLFSGYSY